DDWTGCCNKRSTLSRFELHQDLTAIERRGRVEVHPQVLAGTHDRLFRAKKLIHVLALDVLAARAKVIDRDVEVEPRHGEVEGCLGEPGRVSGHAGRDAGLDVLLRSLAVVDDHLAELVLPHVRLLLGSEFDTGVECEEDLVGDNPTSALRAPYLKLHRSPRM